jgi:hypothetical protein
MDGTDAVFFLFLQMPQDYFLSFFCHTWSIGLSVCPSIQCHPIFPRTIVLNLSFFPFTTSSHISKGHCLSLSLFLSFYHDIPLFPRALVFNLFLFFLLFTLFFFPIVTLCFYLCFIILLLSILGSCNLHKLACTFIYVPCL